MAKFCTVCGRPLPENGVCPCQTQQQPQFQQVPQPQQTRYQQPKAPNPLAKAFADFFPSVMRSVKDPIAEVQSKMEGHNLMFGVACLIVFAAASLLSWFTHSAGAKWALDGMSLPSWQPMLISLAFTVLTAAGCIGANFLSCLASGAQKPAPMDVLTVSLSSLLLPACAQTAAILMNLWRPLGAFVALVIGGFTTLLNYRVSTKVLKADTFWTMLIHAAVAALVFGLSYLLYKAAILNNLFSLNLDAWF